MQESWKTLLNRKVSGALLFAPGISVKKNPLGFGDGNGYVTDQSLTHAKNPPHIAPPLPKSPFWSKYSLKFAPRLLLETQLAQKNNFPDNIPTLVILAGEESDKYVHSKKVRQWVNIQNFQRAKRHKEMISLIECEESKHELDNETDSFGGKYVRDTATKFLFSILNQPKKINRVDESWNRHPACKPVYYNKTTYGSTLDSLNTLESYKKDWFTISDKNNAIDSPWPAPFSLSKADVYAYNKIYIKASAEKIFNFLTKAYMWPSWYPNSGRIIDLDHPKQALVLKDKQSFSWVTFGSRQKSQVTLFKKNKALGWTAESPGVSAYHRWFFIEKNGGTEVITEELDYGLLLDIGFANVLAKGLHASHQLWLEKLKKICENEN